MTSRRDPPIRTNRREWLQEIIDNFEESQDYNYEIVSLDTELPILSISPVGPQDEAEDGVADRTGAESSSSKERRAGKESGPPAFIAGK